MSKKGEIYEKTDFLEKNEIPDSRKNVSITYQYFSNFSKGATCHNQGQKLEKCMSYPTYYRIFSKIDTFLKNLVAFQKNL